MNLSRVGLAVLAASAVAVAGDGWLFAVAEHIAVWHGVYCVWMTGLTVGGDVSPTGWGYACLAFAPVPLLAALFGLFTSALAGVHTRKSEAAIKTHMEARLTEHHDAIKTHMDNHVAACKEGK